MTFKVIVHDRDWDTDTYDNAGDVEWSELGMFRVFDRENRVVAAYAPGSWLKVDFEYEEDNDGSDD